MPESREEAGKTPQDPGQDPGGGHIDEKDVEDIENQSRLRTPIIYEIVRREGEDEMARPAISLWWSGVAAGLSMSFSLIGQAVLHQHLPDAPWRPLVADAGYTVGFIIVVLARQQLFTENTITVVLPVMAEPSLANLGRLGRMWGIVFAANMAGALMAALFCAHTSGLSPELRDAMIELSRQGIAHPWGEMLLRAIPAGFLIAAMVWLIPSAKDQQFQVVALMTYLIGVGGFVHIVAGSVEAWLLLVSGQLGFWAMVGGFTVPALIGNVIGGTVLFALLSYAQVMQEI